jgi:hypothetical protein
MRGTRVPWRWAASLRRQLGLDANPVRRGTDRAEAWTRIGLLVLFLMAAPVTSIALAHWTESSMVSQARSQAAAKHLVPATLLASAPPASTYPETEGNFSWVRARWAGPHGTQRAGQVDVPDGARKGSTVKVWTDASGHLVMAPIARTQIISRVITVTALAPLGVALVLLTMAGVTHRVLDRRRMAAWEADWNAVEPQWSRRPH